jgi:hypothetical protein
MKTNMGGFDRIARICVSVIIAVLYGTNVIGGTLGMVFLVVAGIFLLTSLMGWCPLYTLFGVRTTPDRNAGGDTPLS